MPEELAVGGFGGDGRLAQGDGDRQKGRRHRGEDVHVRAIPVSPQGKAN